MPTITVLKKGQTLSVQLFSLCTRFFVSKLTNNHDARRQYRQISDLVVFRCSSGWILIQT